jgi:cytoskeleton protein RodZ
MGSFGENLRREREMRGVTLEDIAVATKISARFLECIENEDFAKLPGGIFTRSFIRSYGRYLGLDEETLLAEYQQTVGDHFEPDLSRLAGLRRPPVEEKRSRTAEIALPVAVILLLTAGYAFWRRSRATFSPFRGSDSVLIHSKPVIPSTGGGASQVASRAANSANLSSGGGKTTTTSATSTASTGSPGNNTAAATSNAPSLNPLPAQGGLDLQIAATERSWVTVKADGQTVFQGILHANDVKSFQASKEFDVLTGNAQGVVLTLNGQTLKPLGQKGEVKSVRLTEANLVQSMR